MLADGVSSMTLLVNGGDIAWQDVSESVAAGRPVLVIAGSGRTADTLADALRREATDERAAELAQTGLLHAADLGADSAVLSRAIEGLLFAPRTS